MWVWVTWIRANFFLNVRDVDLYCEDTGGTGEPILFLHGFLFGGRMYEAQVCRTE